MRMYVDQRYEVYSVCAFGGGRFASAGAERLLLLYGGPEHVEDLEKSVVKVEASAPVVTRERLVGRQSVEDARGAQAQELRPRTPTRVRFDNSASTSVDSTSEHVDAPLKGLMAEAAAGRPKAGSQAGYPAEAGKSKEDALKQRRAKLMANSNLDITMSDFRRQLITASEPEEDGREIEGHGYQSTAVARGRLPYISEDLASSSNIDGVPDWGLGSTPIFGHNHPRDDRFSVDSASSVTSMNSMNSAFEEHGSGSNSGAAPTLGRKVNISPSNLETDDLMFETCKALPKALPKDLLQPSRQHGSESLQ